MTKLVVSLILVSLLTTSNNALADVLKGQVEQTQVALTQSNNTYQGGVSQERSRVQILIPQQGQPAQREEQGQVSQPQYQVEINHGCQPIGVIGVKINEDGTIVRIYPVSNLLSLGIVPGDQIVAVEGNPVDPGTFETVCRGIPGQYRNLTVVRNGQCATINVSLIDARMLVKYNSEYERSASMTRFW